MRKEFEIEIGKQKNVFIGFVDFSGENDIDDDGPLVRFHVETVYVETIHTVTDTHTRADGVENYGSFTRHTVSETRGEWFAIADKIVKNKIDFLALLAK